MGLGLPGSIFALMANVQIPKVETIVVAGAGTMGAGIAQTALAAGYKVYLVDTRHEALEAARHSLSGRFDSLHEKGKLSEEPRALLARLTVGALADAPPFQLMIEAVAEIAEVKQALLALAYRRCPDALFASNTSSLSVDALAAGFAAPERILGLHFFNPAPLMPLVEVVQGSATLTEVMTWGKSFCESLGKTPVLVKDSPGFIVNRVARPYYTEAMRIVEAGGADFAAIDTALRAQGFRMGPFELMDMIGLDINYNVTRLVWEGLGQPARFVPNDLQGSRVDQGDLGVKTGKGFYEHPAKI